jgi:hypothetical protein
MKNVDFFSNMSEQEPEFFISWSRSRTKIDRLHDTAY